MKKERELNIIERYTKEGQFQIGSALLELEARQKSINLVLDEIRDVLKGMAQWSSEVETRLQKVDPKIEVISEFEGKRILNGK